MNEIKKFASAMMHTSKVVIDAEVNKYVWHKGIRNVPLRIRVKLTRKRNEDEDAKEKMTTHVRVPTARARTRAPTRDRTLTLTLPRSPQVTKVAVGARDFKGKLTENVDLADE